MLTLDKFDKRLDIQEFLTVNYGAEVFQSLELLAESGSSRKYYRFHSAGKSLILTQGENIEENETFLYFTKHFSKVIDNLPKVFKVSEDFTLYTQEDLGSTSLMNVLESDRPAAWELFKEATKRLVRMQVLGDKDLDYFQCFSYPDFNYVLVLRDLFSFKNYFLNLSGIEFNHGRLLKDFEHFAKDFEQIPYKYFVFRDFQSRNIMVRDEIPYFIDYQGGMKGPIQYDLVSLLWQARADLSDDWKDEMYEIYVNEFIDLTGQDLDGFEFKKGYNLCLLERLLQVLGTYGLRGIYERKPHFLKSIEFAINNLRKIENLVLLDEYPELKSVIYKLTEPKVFENLKKKIDG